MILKSDFETQIHLTPFIHLTDLKTSKPLTKNIYPCGHRLTEETERRSGLKQYPEELYPALTSPVSNRGNSCVDQAERFMSRTIHGATSLAHYATLRHEEEIQCIFGWEKGLASPSTLSRFSRKFDQERNEKFHAINRFWFSKLKLDKMTIDLDSTVIIRHNNQDGVVKGHPKRCGRGYLHQLIAFVAEAKKVAHNLRNLFLLQVLNQKQHPVVSTVRFQGIAIGSYLVKTTQKPSLKLSTMQNRQHFLEGLFSKASILLPPFLISNA